MNKKFLLAMLLLGCTLPLFAQMRITEYMYSSNNTSGTGPGEFVELTNVGNTAINLTGWSFDDSDRAPGSFPISSFGVVQPSESVIITDATASVFRAFWSLPNSVKVLGGNNQNLARSDELNIFNGSNTLVDRLTYNDQGIPGSIRTQFRSGWATPGNLGTNMIASWVLSSVGDAQNSSMATTGDIGNPGRYIGSPPSPNAPTIRVANTTTSFISLPTDSPGEVSGVIGDPTDPASTFGVDFILTDPDTDVNSLAVIANSSNGNVTLNLTGTGATRNLKITPIAVGYVAITVSATDGVNTTNYTISYAASAASATQNTSRTRFHTGSSDASTAISVDGNYMVVADDESQLLRLYDRAGSGLPVTGFDVTSFLGLTDTNNSGVPREVDMEASIRQNNRIFWIGSESNNDDGESRPNRNRVFATDMTPNGVNTTLTYVGRYDHLREDIINWDINNVHGKGANHYGLQASAAATVNSKDPTGYNIEGAELAPDGTTAYIGLRAPQVLPANRQKALIIPVTNLTNLVNSQPLGSATFGMPIELDLGGRGIREIRKNTANEYVIIAGPAGDATGIAPFNFRLYTWTGNAADKPVERTANLTTLNANGSFESILEVPNALNNASQLQVLVDNGDATYYNDGTSAKDLSQSTFKKFRSDLVTLGAPVNTPPVLVNGINNQTSTVNQPFSYTVSASTFTDTETPNALTLTVTGLPTGLAFTNGIISGTPSATGISTVTVTATDPGGLFASTAFMFTVTSAPTNTPPTVISTIDNQTGMVNEPFSYTLLASTFTDAETPNTLTLTVMGLPTGLSFANGIVSGTPSVSGTSTVTVTAIDPGSLAVSTQFTFTVNPLSLLVLIAPTYDCQTGELTFNTDEGDGSPIEYMIMGVSPAPDWTANSTIVIPLALRTDPNVSPLTLMARQSGVVVSFLFDLQESCKFRTLKPTYNCDSGLLIFNTSGGTDLPIEYQIPGVVSFNLNRTAVVPLWIRTDLTGVPLQLKARQSGKEDTYEFTIQEECPAVPGELNLIAPAYTCSTGALAFNTRGGNSTPIEYMISGVTGWSSNPNFIVPASARRSAVLLTLSVRQSGIITSVDFDFRDFCSPAPLLEVVAPTYNCLNGTLAINVQGGEW
ncbi:putative Ig domain-containing protein [Spirosoma validum]|uniref:Lamin tail domain-containing protein n=1 Tax=Spirosoma validum TaxID=2771355 RepID=A0A927B412_9BACT|nr:putative Ig domain-containing protein [Spirosoma validum]MBD2755226.1 lamin tail domain-containing protein [Spirosoma validum]